VQPPLQFAHWEAVAVAFMHCLHVVSQGHACMSTAPSRLQPWHFKLSSACEDVDVATDR
jgi:hypothetical protein